MTRRGLLLDRDGVVNVDHGYVGHKKDFVFTDGIFPFLKAAQDKGYHIAILTNQSSVARGLYTVKDYQNLTGWMLDELSREGIAVELVLACFEHRQGTVAALARESFWRKPNPGMVLEAVQKLRLDPSRSIFIGDQQRDMDAAKAGHIGQCLLLQPKAARIPDGVTVITSLADALRAL